MSSSVVLAGGQVHVHLACSDCSSTAWSHQQIATLAEQIAQRVNSLPGRSATPIQLKPEVPGPSMRDTPPPSLGKNGPRTRTGCFTCRGKRVKCDEAKPICTRCRRNPERQCVYPKATASPAPRSKPAGPPPSLSSSKIAQRRSQGSRALSARPPPPMPLQGQDLIALFLDGISFLAEPGLLNVRPTKPGARARSDRVLAKLWEAQMFVSASGEFNPAAAGRQASGHAALANALVSATRSLGAVKRAFSQMKPTAAHAEMFAASRQLASDAASVIVGAIRGTALNDPETMCILFELFLMRDCASGDPEWNKTHQLLREYLIHTGGPQRLLENDRAALLGNSILEDHLVYLTVYDTFAALTTNVEPLMLAPGHTRWIEDVTCAQQVVHADFGFSLKILSTVAQLATLLAHKPYGTPGSIASDAESDGAYVRACRALNEELETDTLATIYSTTAPTRVQFGDLLIRHALICHLRRIALGRSRDDERIQASAAAIVELLVEVSIRTGSMINLNYPIIVAAGLIPPEERERMQTIIDFVRLTSCLQEVYRMEEIVHDCWRRTENGEDVRMTDTWNANSHMLIL